MPEQLPFFPLQLVVYPGEYLNLHIFELRYRQLLRDCLDNGKPFGIPTYLKDSVQAFGTEVNVVEVVREYEDGKMDIRTQGNRVFKMMSFRNPMKAPILYAGGEVSFFEETDDSNAAERLLLMEQVDKLFQLMSIFEDVDTQMPFLSYRLGHKLGLSLEQEYQLLAIRSESQRQQYLTDHLKRTYPVLEEMERTKTRIRMNGHFRHFDPLNF